MVEQQLVQLVFAEIQKFLRIGVFSSEKLIPLTAFSAIRKYLLMKKSNILGSSFAFCCSG